MSSPQSVSRSHFLLCTTLVVSSRSSSPSSCHLAFSLSELGFAYSPFPWTYPFLFSLIFFPSSVLPSLLKTRGSDLSAFLYFSELWYIKMHVNAGSENRGMAERSTKTVLLLRTVLNCSSISFCRNLEVISLLLNMQYILYSI